MTKLTRNLLLLVTPFVVMILVNELVRLVDEQRRFREKIREKKSGILSATESLTKL
jgi:hypothetical protein